MPRNLSKKGKSSLSPCFCTEMWENTDKSNFHNECKYFNGKSGHFCTSLFSQNQQICKEISRKKVLKDNLICHRNKRKHGNDW